MSTESPFTGAPQHKPLEKLKETFKHRLDVILNEQLTVENVETFADKALEETTKLVDDILSEYSRNPNFKATPTTAGIKEQENEAFGILGLPDIQEVLSRISAVKDKIDDLKRYLSISQQKIGTVITPPQDGRVEITPGSGTFAKKEIFPRLLTLLYIMEQDFDISKEDLKITEGSVKPKMMRQTPYARVEIPKLNRVVYICDEEGNASYVFDTKKLAEANLSLEEIDVDDKREKNSLIADYPGIGIHISQTSNWRFRIAEVLAKPIPKKEAGAKEEDEVKRGENLDRMEDKEIVVVSRGELDPWSGFWTDPSTQEHWGTQAAIAKKLKKSVVIFKERTGDERVKTRPIKVRNRWGGPGRTEDGYCFERMLEFFPELEDINKVETKGEWRGFWTDSAAGKHWGSAGALTKKFGVRDWITIKKFARRGSLKSITITDTAGRRTEGYCYEDFFENERFMEFLTMPEKVDEGGEWRGFWTDDKGNHWATKEVLASHFGLSRNTIGKFAEKIGLQSKKVKSRYKEVLNAFCLESFLNNKEFTEFLTLPRVDNEGLWAGFWTDPITDKHWGAILQISRRMEMNREKLTELIRDKQEKFPAKTIKNEKGSSFDGYCFEDIKTAVSEK